MSSATIGSQESYTLRYLMEHLDQGVWEFDAATGAFTASASWYRLRGRSPDTPIGINDDDWLVSIHPDDRETLRSTFYGQKGGSAQNIVVQYRHVHPEGHWVWILCRASVMEVDDTGRPLKIVGTDTDISEAMENQNELQELAGKLQLAVQASRMGIWEFDPVSRLVHWDDRLLKIYGLTDGKNTRSDDLWETYIHPDDYEQAVAYAEECNRKKTDLKLDFRIVRPDGEIRHIRSLARTVETNHAKNKLIGVNIDVTEDYLRAQELELAKQKLEHDAMHDPLTGLGNRRALDKDAMALFNSVPADGRYVAMHVDLDHFKAVNDTLGHSAGDFVLTSVAQILRDAVGDLGQAFRTGGDEFAILFETAPPPSRLNAFCEDLIARISAPMTYEDQPCAVGASIGYAIGVGPPDSPFETFINADAALYTAKRAGRYCYRAYTPEIGADFHLISKSRQLLRDALDTDQIVCFFQPQLDVDTLQITGAEALVRWNCPTRGLLTPDKFLPQALDAGLLSAIDHHVFTRVTALQTLWLEEGLDVPRLSVNVSMARFYDEKLIEQTRAALQDHHRISFELLETIFLDSPSKLQHWRLDALREMGIKIELDDFGTGHSSIRALQAIQPDAVKIDRSLVAPMSARNKQVRLLESVTRIARLEGAEIVVEGLETGFQLAAVRKLDCDRLQGYALHRPMREVEFASLLRQATSPAAADDPTEYDALSGKKAS
ncbi:MAG: EAL domain-containing protein [Pseudomonadota bacterium]